MLSRVEDQDSRQEGGGSVRTGSRSELVGKCVVGNRTIANCLKQT